MKILQNHIVEGTFEKVTVTLFGIFTFLIIPVVLLVIGFKALPILSLVIIIFVIIKCLVQS